MMMFGGDLVVVVMVKGGRGRSWWRKPYYE